MDKVMAGFNNFLRKKVTKKGSVESTNASSTFEESKESMIGMSGEMIVLNKKKDELKS